MIREVHNVPAKTAMGCVLVVAGITALPGKGHARLLRGGHVFSPAGRASMSRRSSDDHAAPIT